MHRSNFSPSRPVIRTDSGAAGVSMSCIPAAFANQVACERRRSAAMNADLDLSVVGFTFLVWVKLIWEPG